MLSVWQHFRMLATLPNVSDDKLAILLLFSGDPGLKSPPQTA